MQWGEVFYLREATIAHNAVFRGDSYSRGLLNKGGVYSRKYMYGMLKSKAQMKTHQAKISTFVIEK